MRTTVNLPSMISVILLKFSICSINCRFSQFLINNGESTITFKSSASIPEMEMEQNFPLFYHRGDKVRKVYPDCLGNFTNLMINIS
ncbi:unnamed protein product [Rhizophagus irregularis]|uniref:Uncharacterized protein n=1 Tax=Rhizophagus irregularis TaxID=588596 RepID=A0A916ECE4_9GLOM|nr:unnamed protein product [Rhizophagus irregularis]CAB5377193.1 unnamed protein product [Rhizophagus irregularis]